MSLKGDYNRIKAERIISNIEKRNMLGYYAETVADAKEKLFSLLRENASVSWGGTETLRELDIREKLKSMNMTIFDRDVIPQEEQSEFFAKVINADYYLMSCNAITEKGEMVNIDGRSNRVASLVFGPKNVIVLASMNKVCADIDSAMHRARNYAAPLNVARLNKDTPCRKVSKCTDCTESDCICANIVITRFSVIKDRIKIILINDENSGLGF